MAEFSAGAALSADDRVLEVSLPALPAGRVNALELTLPVQADRVPEHLLAEVAPVGDAVAGWHMAEVPVQSVSSGYWRLDLSALTVQPLSAARWRFRPTEDSGADWRWRPWTAADPASWLVSWQEAAHRASGREQLQGVLSDLLPSVPDTDTTVRPVAAPEDAAALTLALRRLPSGAWPPGAETGAVSGDSDCESAAVLQLGLSAISPVAGVTAAEGLRTLPQRWQIVNVTQPWPVWSSARAVGLQSLPAELDRWRDQALAPPPVLAALQPRHLGAAFLGLDVLRMQPVPGRLAWYGNHQFVPCGAPEDCVPDGQVSGRDLGSQLSREAATLLWLSDAGLAAGQVLHDWRTVLDSAATQNELLSLLGRAPDADQRAWLQAALQDELAHPPVLQGAARYIDDGPDPGRAGGRRGYIAWGMADGGLLWLDADTGQPRWGWRPASLLAHWLRHRLDPGVSAPSLVAASDWQIWPAGSEYRPGQPRYLYGLGDGQLLALDITQPLQPRLLFQAMLPPDARVGSLSIFRLADSDSRPLLLLARGSPVPVTGQTPSLEQGSPERLWLMDGRSGNILWRAAASGYAADVVDARLTTAWRASWQRLIAADGRQLIYGVDLGGQVWRLTLPASATIDTLPGGISLQEVATLSDPALATGAERFEEAPSLTWLAGPEGDFLPALTLGSRTATGEAGVAASVFSWLDRSGSGTPSLVRNQLTEWPAARLTPPDHVWGWRRHWAHADEQLASSPRWLLGQVVLATETAEPLSGCLPQRWRQRLYRLPWRVTAEGAESEAGEQDLGVTAVPLPSSPVLTDTGVLVWPGSMGAALALRVPAPYRQRTGRQMVPLPR